MERRVQPIAPMFLVDDVDLGELTAALLRCFGETLVEGYLDGRTILRDAVATQLGCSVLEAEELVDTLESRGFLRFPQLPDETHSHREHCWLIVSAPENIAKTS